MATNADLTTRIARYKGFLAVDPANVQLLAALGDLYHQAGQLDEALDCMDKCVTLAPHEGTLRSSLANVLISKHRFADAEATLAPLVAENTNDAALLHNLGLAVYHQERFEEALDLFARAQACGLAAPSNWAYLARSLHQAGDTTRAIEACERWAASAGDDASKSYLALLRADNGELPVAAQAAREVASRDPADVNANLVLGTHELDRHDTAKARQHFEAVLQVDAGNGRAWLGLGMVGLHEQNFPDAITALERSTQIYRNHAGALVALGWARFLAGDAEGSAIAFEQAVRSDGEFAEGHGGLAAALVQTGHLDQAESAAKRAQQIDPECFGAKLAMTAILALRGKPDQAADVLESMLQGASGRSATSLVDSIRDALARQRGVPTKARLH